jgi:hypothetical protein
MFEKASRLQLRFDTPKGLITTEDLWDLPLTGNSVNLDKIAVGLSRQLKDENTESFVVTATKANDELQLKFDIVKHIIDVKLAEKAAAKQIADTKAKKAKLLEVLARKQDAALENASEEDIKKMIDELAAV